MGNETRENFLFFRQLRYDLYVYFNPPLKPHMLRGDCAFPRLPVRPDRPSWTLQQSSLARLSVKTLKLNSNWLYTTQLPYDVLVAKRDYDKNFTGSSEYVILLRESALQIFRISVV